MRHRGAYIEMLIGSVIGLAASFVLAVDALVLDTPQGLRAILVNLSDVPHDAHLTGAMDVSVTLEPHAIVTIDLPGRAP